MKLTRSLSRMDLESDARKDGILRAGIEAVLKRE